jgi:hypothetical protein
MVAFFLVGIPAIEGVGENVKDYDSVNSEFDGTGMINNIYKSVFQWVPLIFLGGMMLWAVLWYFQRERFAGYR